MKIGDTVQFENGIYSPQNPALYEVQFANSGEIVDIIDDNVYIHVRWNMYIDEDGDSIGGTIIRRNINEVSEYNGE